MTPDGESVPKPRHPLRILVWIVAVAAVAAGGYALYDKVIKNNGNGSEITGAGQNKYTLNFPAGWTPLTQKELDALPGKPTAVIRQKDGKGFLVLRVKGRAPTTFTKFSGDLTTEFQKRVKDFEEQSSRTIKIKAGKAFFYSYIRKKAGTVHTVVVVPAGNKSYVINTVSAGGEKQIAKQIADMILSFKT